MAGKTDMLYVNLGNSGLKISKIILGCMSYGSPNFFPWLLSEEVGIEHIGEAYKLGINTFDTADVYSSGISEQILGRALKMHNIPREKVVIMTKFSGIVSRNPGEIIYPHPRLDQDGYVNQYGASRKHIFDAVQASLKRLQVDYIDVYQMHRFDPNTPIAETMTALHDIVKAGYVRYIGMSSCWAYQFHLMQNYAITHNLTPFISMQNHYSAVYREEEREMMLLLEHFGVGSIPWSPLGRGVLCRPWSESSDRSGKDQFQAIMKATSKGGDEGIVKAVEEIAKERNLTMAQVAFAWVANKKGVSAPIVGTTKIESLRELAKAVHIKLTEVRSLDLSVLSG
ncbi:aryl-alcohol dehydrogenase [Atractiella rhizophila]|nr:aryl-alcohol dehydrogenase [Atractiella rhizophila]